MTAMLLLLATTAITAQRGQGPRDQQKAPFAELELSPEQKEQLKTIREENRKKMEALRGTNPEERPSREAMQKLRETSRQEMEAILTPEQREKMAKLTAERKEAYKNVDKKALKADLKKQREEAKKVVSAARGQLESFISPEDKVAIERLRGVYATKPKAKRGTDNKGRSTAAQKEAIKAENDQWKEAHKADITEAKALAEKYSADIERIHEKLAPQVEKWKQEKREIFESYFPAKAAPHRGAKRGQARKKDEGRSKDGRDQSHKSIGFLLMKG